MNAKGEAQTGPLRLQFDRSVQLAFRGALIGSDGGLLLHRELDDALGLTDMAAEVLADTRTGRNGRHKLAGFLRQSIFSRLAGYEDVNDADRLCRDPVLRQVVGGRAVKYGAASASALGRFETEMLTQAANLEALAGTAAARVLRHPCADQRSARATNGDGIRMNGTTVKSSARYAGEGKGVTRDRQRNGFCCAGQPSEYYPVNVWAIQRAGRANFGLLNAFVGGTIGHRNPNGESTFIFLPIARQSMRSIDEMGHHRRRRRHFRWF